MRGGKFLCSFMNGVLWHSRCQQRLHGRCNPLLERTGLVSGEIVYNRRSNRAVGYGGRESCHRNVTGLRLQPPALLCYSQAMQKKVLVVEDDSELVELLSFNLKKAGFAVGTAGDGIEALKKARSLLPDLILLDLMLPELDGFAVCEILRKAPQTATVPIIMLTALSGQLARFNRLEAGASEYITKPFTAKDLLCRVEGLLGDKSSR